MEITFYDQKEDLLYELLDHEPIDVLPFRKKLEKLQNTEELLEYIAYVKENKLFHLPFHCKLVKIEEPLKMLNQLVGMTEIKQDLVYQIVYYCKHIEQQTDLLNCVFYGPPGCGKTTVAYLFGQIFLKLGHLKNDKFVVGTLENMIAEYVGQTAPKTKKLLDSARGGVLFLDEVYQFGSSRDGNRDSFCKQMIDTINQDITANPGSMMIIIAGYKDRVKKDFFSQNEGLERRFPWVYTINLYTAKELWEIFILQCQQEGYNTNFCKYNHNFIQANYPKFKNLGGDTRLLVDKCKRVYTLRTALEVVHTDKMINDADFELAFKLFLSHKNDPQQEMPEAIKNLYC